MAAAGRAGAYVPEPLGEPSPLDWAAEVALQAASLPPGAATKRERDPGLGRALRSVRRCDSRFASPSTSIIALALLLGASTAAALKQQLTEQMHALRCCKAASCSAPLLQAPGRWVLALAPACAAQKCRRLQALASRGPDVEILRAGENNVNGFGLEFYIETPANEIAETIHDVKKSWQFQLLYTVSQLAAGASAQLPAPVHLACMPRCTKPARDWSSPLARSCHCLVRLQHAWRQGTATSARSWRT